MGRSITTHKYEITPEIKELQQIALDAKNTIGIEVSVDITQDLVTINGFRKMNRVEAKSYLLDRLQNRETLGTQDVPDAEEEEREAKRQAKLNKKKREPGAPPELKALIRRAKRIYKKSQAKGLTCVQAFEKAQAYIDRKGTEEDRKPAISKLFAYTSQEENQW